MSAFTADDNNANGVGAVRGVSLFSGAGGMDCGFHATGVTTVYANEIDRDAADTFMANAKYVDSGAMHVGDIEAFMPEIEALSDIDVVFGGPPCQGLRFHLRLLRSVRFWASVFGA